MKKNSHGFWAGVVIMILLACMSLKDILKESDWEGGGGVTRLLDMQGK